jgi:predicted dehydrogenase
MQEIRWGIIGCGNVTEVKSGPAFNKVPHSELIAVMRRDEALLKDYALRHKVPYTFTNASDLINHLEVDAVYIATPPGVHEQYVVEALLAKKKVYVEKPMSTTVAACLRMQDVANQVNGKLVIAHYRRALPIFLKIKELLSQNYIGKVHTVKINMQKNAAEASYYNNNWRVNKAAAGGGLFYDLAPHQLDLVIYFFGEAFNYSGMATNKAGLYDVEDTVTGKMQLQKGIEFVGDWCFAADTEKEKDEFIIQGEKGSIHFAVFGQQIVIEKEGQRDIIHFEPPAHIQQPMIEKIVNYFLDKAPNPCSAADAIQSMRVMEAFVYGNNL